MQLSTKIFYNTTIQAFSKIFSIILGLFALALMTRYLGQQGFGEYTTIMTFLSFFGIMADLGLTLVTVQMISQPNIDENKILGNLFGMRLFTAIIFLGLAPLIVLFFPYNSAIKIGVAIGTFSFLFVALNQILVGLFQKNLRMDKVAISEIITRMVYLMGIVFIIKKNYGIFGIMGVAIVSGAINFFVCYLFSKNFVELKIYFNKEIWKNILSKSWPLALTIFFNLLYLKTDILFLSIIPRSSPAGIIAEVGLYGAAYKVIDVLATLPFMFAGIVLPILTTRWAKKETHSFKTALQRSFEAMAILAIPMVVGAQFISTQVMVLVGGRDFSASGPVLQILIIAAGFIFIGNIFSHAMIAVGEQKKLIPLYIFTAITAIAGYLIFIPLYSYFGAAWVTVYSEAVIALLSILYARKYLNFLPNFVILLKSALAAGAMGLTMFVCQRVFTTNLITIIILSFLTYFLFLYLLKGLNKKDFMIIFNK